MYIHFVEKIAYLQKYSGDIKLVDMNSLTVDIKNTLPEYWNKLLLTDDFELRKNILFGEWSKYNYQYQSTISYLKINLTKVELIFNNNKYSLLYSVKNKSGNVVYYEGKNPLDKNIPKT